MFTRKLIVSVAAFLLALTVGLNTLAADSSPMPGGPAQAEITLTDVTDTDVTDTDIIDTDITNTDVTDTDVTDTDVTDTDIVDTEMTGTDVTGTDLPDGEPASDGGSVPLAEGGVIVFTLGELKRALGEDNGYTTVYLGANIATDAAGMSIHPAKEHVVVDGTPPGGERHALIQNGANVRSQLIRVDDDATLTHTVTLRNMDIAGANYYGVVSVKDGLQGRVTLEFIDIDYTGPQAAYHRAGTVRFVGGSYSLITAELAEALHVELGGELTVTAPSAANAILWMTSRQSTLTVLEDADVTVDTSFYFIYGSIASATLRENAALRLTSRRFGFSYAADSVETFIMRAGSRLHIDLNTVESYAALRVSKLFRMEPDSSATILRRGTDGIALRLTAAGARAVFDRPERVFLYSSAGVPIRFTGAGELSIATSAINVWSRVSWPLPEGLSEQPSHVWNRAGEDLLNLTASYSETVNLSLAHNLTNADPVISSLTAQTFSLEKNRLVAFGGETLTIDASAGDAAATGSASPDAVLQADIARADGRSETATGTAGSDGRYALTAEGGGLSEGDGITVIARARNLFIRQTHTVADTGARALSFVSVPTSIGFGAQDIPAGQALAERPGAMTLAVSDTRQSPSPWRIDADLTGPLEAILEDGRVHRLADALVFRMKDGTTLPLNEAPTTIYRQAEGQHGETALRWEGGEGPLLRLSPGEVYSGVDYTTTIHWTLVDAP